MGLQYAFEVQGTTMLRCVGKRGALGERMSVVELGVLLHGKLRAVTWREDTKATLRSRFARTRVVIDRDDGKPRKQVAAPADVCAPAETCTPRWATTSRSQPPDESASRLP